MPTINAKMAIASSVLITSALLILRSFSWFTQEEQSISTPQSSLSVYSSELGGKLAQQAERKIDLEPSDALDTVKRQLGGDHVSILKIRSLFAAGKTEEAQELLRQQIAMNPRDEVYLEEMGMIQLRHSKPEEAEDWFKKVLAINPRNEVALGELTDLLNATGRSNEAFDTLKNIADSCNGPCPTVNLALGNMLLNSGDLNQAIVELRKAQEGNSVREAALQSLSMAYTKIDDRENAALVLGEIISFKRKYIQSLKTKGVDVQVLEKSLKQDAEKFFALEQGG